MTGFAQREVEIDGQLLSITVRSVNSRGFEFIFKSCFTELEFELKKKARNFFQRGKIELSVNFPQRIQNFSFERFKANVSDFTNAVSELGIKLAYDAGSLLRIYERSIEPEAQCDLEKLKAEIERSFLELDQYRKKEGESHLFELKELLGKLERLRTEVEKRAEKSSEDKQAYLKTRLLALAPIDDLRILQEIAILADRISIGEEILRLSAHEVRYAELLSLPSPHGRELEFLSQELLREWNTIGSKSQDSEIAHAVVDAKVCIEQIRELAANVV